MKIHTILLTLALSLNLTISLAQASGRKSVELLPLEVYQHSLKVYHNKLWSAQRKEFADLNIKSWIYYLPSVGFQFGLPSVQFSSKELLTYKREKKLLEAKLKALDASAELELNLQLQTLKTRYINLEYEILRLEAFKRTQSAKEGIWAIQMECCSKNQCSPLECRKIELESIQAEESFKNLQTDYILKILAIEEFSKYDLPAEKIYFNKSECILESEEFRLFKK